MSEIPDFHYKSVPCEIAEQIQAAVKEAFKEYYSEHFTDEFFKKLISDAVQAIFNEPFSAEAAIGRMEAHPDSIIGKKEES